MKKKVYSLISAMLISVAGLFVLTGSYFLINKPEIPEELRTKKAV
ncbi:cyclic lactone autoinducer peptide [Paenibacillaceae bacterium]|nr:cyclic lactone autoinducer peptide [Paenibacillaceae bacterium]